MPERPITTTVDGLAVSRRPGPGPRVVLVHGAMDRAGGFAKVLRRLPDLDLVRYDRRGYGQSRDGRLASIDDHVADLLAIIGDEPAILVGHSLGGVLTLAAAQRRPDLVPAVAAFEAPMPWSSWWPRSSAGAQASRAAGPRGEDAEAVAEQFLRRMLGDALWERFPESMKQDRRGEGPALLAELRSMRRDPPAVDHAALTVPVLAGHGSVSRAHHIEAARRLAEDAPDAELVVIEGAGHGAHFTHAAEFASFIDRAVARAEGVGSPP